MWGGGDWVLREGQTGQVWGGVGVGWGGDQKGTSCAVQVQHLLGGAGI